MTAVVLLAALYTSTAQVNGLAAQGSTLWAATAGGVEQYDLRAGRRARLYTTEAGLDSNSVQRIWIAGGAVHARTASSECTLASGSFACAPASPLVAAAPAAAEIFHGARVTARLAAAGRSLVATAGQGLWSNGQRLTPAGQICGNHLEALVEFKGELWAGAFDGGLCVLRADGGFRPVPAPFRMVNDLRATPRGLYVAAAEGLFVSRDGRSFRREGRVRERGANRLAATGRWLFVTTPAVLYALRLDGRDVVRRFRHPAGSTALQAVAVSGAEVWLASEDVGVIRLRRGKFEAFDRASGLPSSWTVDVAAAPGGGVWAATLRDGAVRLDADGSVRERGRDRRAWGLRLYDDGGQVLFGTQQGLAPVGRTESDASPPSSSQPAASGRLDASWPPLLPGVQVHALLRTRDGLWVGTEDGLSLMDLCGHGVMVRERRSTQRAPGRPRCER